jgi:hypothetical protein
MVAKAVDVVRRLHGGCPVVEMLKWDVASLSMHKRLLLQGARC